MKIVINRCFGGFGLSDLAYERLIQLGVPVRRYVEQVRDPETGLFVREPANEGEVIFDRDLTPKEERSHLEKITRELGRYWDAWIGSDRANKLLVQVVEELGDAANGKHAKLKVVDVPDGMEWTIEEFDGMEHVAEKHMTWD